jgi:hypothetical protein
MLSTMAAHSLERTIGWIDRVLPHVAKKGIQAARTWMMMRR